MADSLKDEATGAASSSAGKKLHDPNQGTFMATYTQRGLQEAYEMFARHNDTTVTIEGHDEPVKRQPVIVLVTDGDPTYCTYHYMDPKSGPNYGNGATFGIEGYYTILSANYFKNLTGIHYGKQAVFYTVGIGILDSGYGSDKEPNKVGYDNSYMRAVLDPTKKNIEALKSYKDYANSTSGSAILKEYWQESSLELTRLLTETCMDSTDTNYIRNDQYCRALNYTYGDDVKIDDNYYSEFLMSNSATGLSYTSNVVYGMANPYKSNYNYVDAAFFGYLDTDDMDNVFNAILDDVQETTRYDYLLKKGTSVTMTDPLGSGMTVKGTPVLRYFGTNYTEAEHTSKSDANYDYVTYYWKKTVDRQESDAKEDDDKTVDISKITLTVATNKTTKEQTVTFDIPESALPTYYPDKFRQFYYEELPVRAIYRVGLSTDEETKLNTAAGGSDKAITNAVYYTNKFDGDTAATTVTFYPDDGNPYYESDEHKSETIAKATNASDTVENSFVETVNDDGSVTQLLGNNGKLVLNRTEKFNITVKKVWEGTPADSVTVQLFISGTMTNTSDESAKPMTFTSAGSKVELNAANNWQYTWSGLPRQAINNGYLYNYTNFYVRETPMDGYTTTYKDKDGNVLQSQDFTYSEGKWVRSDSLSTSELSAYSVGSITWVTTDYTVDVVDANSGEVTIINSKPYELPESGGIGIEWFTLSGMTMIIATSFLYIQIKRKQKQNSRGGEA
jgi:LPXTG-motif cell wall-anchored protein